MLKTEHVIRKNISENSNSSETLLKQPPELFHKQGVLKNFSKFTGKILCHSFAFNKVAYLMPGILLNNRPRQRHFVLKFGKILRIIFFTDHLETTVSTDSRHCSHKKTVRRSWGSRSLKVIAICNTLYLSYSTIVLVLVFFFLYLYYHSIFSP